MNDTSRWILEVVLPSLVVGFAVAAVSLFIIAHFLDDVSVELPENLQKMTDNVDARLYVLEQGSLEALGIVREMNEPIEDLDLENMLSEVRSRLESVKEIDILPEVESRLEWGLAEIDSISLGLGEFLEETEGHIREFDSIHGISERFEKGSEIYSDLRT